MGAFNAACAAPACALDVPPAPSNAFEEFLKSADKAGRFIVEVAAFPKDAAPFTYPSFPACGAPACSIGDPTGEVPQPVLLAFSDHALSFRPNDTLRPNFVPEARLARRVDIQTIFSIVPNTTSAGQTLAGDVEIFNADGYLDTYVEDYVVDGRLVRVLFGPEGGEYSEFRVIEETFGKDWRGDENELRLTLQDLQFKLDQPYQQNTYRGTGTIEGSSDLAGQRKPRLIGHRFNFEPKLIDRANYIYQISDSPIHSIVSIRDGGAAYTDSGLDFSTYGLLASAAIDEGQYATALSLGLVRIRPAGGAPESVVTCEARGDSTGGYSSKIGDLIVREVRNRAGFQENEIDPGSFASMNAFNGGYYYDGSSEITFRQVLTELAGDTNGRIIADSRLRGVRIFDPSSVAASFQLVAEQIEEFEPEGVLVPPIYETVVEWRPNDRVLTQGEVIDPSTDSATKALLQLGFSEVTRRDGSVILRHLGAQKQVRVSTNLIDEESAVVLADAINQLWRAERQIYRIVTNREALFYGVGTVINITYPRFGFRLGKQALIVERRNDYNAQKAELRVLV